MTWMERLRELENSEKGPDSKLTKPTKPRTAGEVSSETLVSRMGPEGEIEEGAI